MKKFVTLIIVSLTFNSLAGAAENCQKYNTVLQSKKFKECLAEGGNVTKQNKDLDNVKGAAKKVLGKLNTDSKLTDYIKKKMGK